MTFLTPHLSAANQSTRASDRDRVASGGTRPAARRGNDQTNESHRPPRALGDGANTADRVGRYVWRLHDDQWSWSPYTFQLFGYRDHGVVPSTALWLRHLDEPDRPRGEHLRDELRRGVRSFSWYHAIRTTSGKLRTVVESGWVLGADPTSAVCHGQIDDISGAVTAEATRAVEASHRTREHINRVQGALMLTHELSADAALQLLIWYSQTHNVKLAALAMRVTPDLHRLGSSGSHARAALDQLLRDAAVELAQGTGQVASAG